jgi:CRP-like cAMP-binding protein
MATILELCGQLPLKVLPTGALLLEEDASSDKIYVLASGTVEILKGDVQVHVSSQPGTIFGEISALLNIPHTATVRALDECRVYEAAHGQAFLAANPELALDLARLLARRLQHVTTYLADLKRQFEDQSDHLGMVDEVLEGLIYAQDGESDSLRGSDREYEPND